MTGDRAGEAVDSVDLIVGIELSASFFGSGEMGVEGCSSELVSR